jgi:carbonic anhydrase
VIVLGHHDCGAVQAAIDVALGGTTLPGEIGTLVQPIIPAVEEVRNAPERELLDRAIRANIRRSVHALTVASPLLSDLVRKGKLEIVGAEYHLRTGEVHVVPPEASAASRSARSCSYESGAGERRVADDVPRE